MSSPIEWLQGEIPPGAIVSKCAKEGCAVSLRKAPSPCWILNMDHSGWGLANQSHCDFLFISCNGAGKTNWVVPLELKKGSPNATEMVRQLQAGANFVQAKMSTQHRTRFLPVGVYGGNLKALQKKKLRQARILFRQMKYEIKLIRCGKPLKEVLS